MKQAIIIATGEVVAIEKIYDDSEELPWSGTIETTELALLSDGRHIPTEELQILCGSSATIACWIARDANGMLTLNEKKPERGQSLWICRSHLLLDSSLFPFVTWDGGPQMVNLTIKCID